MEISRFARAIPLVGGSCENKDSLAYGNAATLYRSRQPGR